MQNHRRAGIAGLSLAAGAVVILLALWTALPGRAGIVRFDVAIVEWLFEKRSPWLTTVMEAVSVPGNLVPAVMAVTAVVALLLSRQRNREALFLIVSSAGGYALSTATKSFVGRLRPDESFHAIHIDSAAFPSGHAWHSFTIFGAMALLAWRASHDDERWSDSRKLIAGLVTAFLAIMGFSRIYLGVHWPSDVVGGWLLGLAWLTFSWAVVLQPEPRSLVESSGSEPARQSAEKA